MTDPKALILPALHAFCSTSPEASGRGSSRLTALEACFHIRAPTSLSRASRGRKSLSPNPGPYRACGTRASGFSTLSLNAPSPVGGFPPGCSAIMRLGLLRSTLCGPRLMSQQARTPGLDCGVPRYSPHLMIFSGLLRVRPRRVFWSLLLTGCGSPARQPARSRYRSSHSGYTCPGRHPMISQIFGLRHSVITVYRRIQPNG